MCDLCGAVPNSDDHVREYVLAREIGITDVRSTLTQELLGEYTVETSYEYIDTVDVSLCQQCLKGKIRKARIKAFVWALLSPAIGFGVACLFILGDENAACAALAPIFLSLCISGFLLWKALSTTAYFDDAAANKVASPFSHSKTAHIRKPIR